MLPIAAFDSDIDNDAPRWHQSMPHTPQRWLVKLWAECHNGQTLETQFRTKQACDYGSLMRQHMTPAVDEMRAEGDGVTRMKFWLYKAR